jgi:CBS-domain-containing membrane protein
MREVPTRMHPKDVLRDVHDRVPTAAEQPLLPIEADGIFLGWVCREDLAGREYRELGGPALAELMTPVNHLPTVRPEQTIAEAVALMNQRCLDYVAVVRQRRLLGMVSRDDVITWICRGGRYRWTHS